MCFIRAYLRASTDEQDADRARAQVEAFAAERGMQIAAWYLENESGAKLARPELFRLLSDAHPGDVLLVEQVDRLSRLGIADWDRLKVELAARKVRVVALDLPTSWTMATGKVDEFTARMFDAINGMMLDMLAAYRPEGLRGPSSPPDAGAGEGAGRGQVCRQAREQEAQCQDRRHAQGRFVIQRRAGSDRLQPRHGGEDRQAREGGRLTVAVWNRKA